MSTHQTRDGRWFVVWWDGQRQRRKVLGRGDIAHRQALRLDHDKKREKGRAPDLDGITISELCSRYHNEHPVEYQTGLNDYYKFDRNILPVLGTIQADLLSTKDLNSYIKKRQADGVKNSTIANEIRRLKAAYSWGMSQDPPLIVRNPAAKFRVPMAKDSTTPNPPSQIEIKKILIHAEAHLLRAIWLLWYLGIRPGKELSSIVWDCVNFDGQWIRITSARKGGPVERMVPFGDVLAGKLAGWMDSDSTWAGDRIGRIAVVNYRGKPVMSLKKAWASAKRSAKIHRELRLYDLRHAFASMVLAQGADLKSVSEVLGHSRPDTTLRAYQHVTRQQHREVVAKVPDLGQQLDNIRLVKPPRE